MSIEVDTADCDEGLTYAINITPTPFAAIQRDWTLPPSSLTGHTGHRWSAVRHSCKALGSQLCDGARTPQ